MEKNIKLLLVEDEQFLYELYEYQFKNAGYDIDLATDGTVALDKLTTQHNYDAVLLDIMLPRMDGIEILKRLREYEQENGKPPVKVIIMTNLGDEFAFERCSQYNISGFVIKARHTPQELQKEVERIIGTQ